MEEKVIAFNFNGEQSDYTAVLGGLTPDPYSYTPQVGDTAEINVKYFGIRVLSGVIKELISGSDRLDSIFQKLSEFESLDEEESKFLEKEFDYCVDEPGSTACAVLIEFNVPVSSSFVKKRLGESDFDGGREIESGNTKAIIHGSASRGYEMTGQVRAVIHSRSIASTFDLDQYKEITASATDVENVAWSDQVLPALLINNINTSLDEICQAEPADYHPGSGKVVRDIVHPSMYCYVKGESQVQGIPGDPLAQSAPSRSENSLTRDFWGRDYEDSIYQWLPAEFFVSEDGKPRITSYVNNLDQEKYPKMYSLLEDIFERVLPMFEVVCGSLRNDFFGVDGKDLGKKSISLRNRTLQVVTKIVEYRVNHEENFDGVWHVEGMSHEEVLATALCVVKRDENFSGAEIEFRRFLFEDEGKSLMYSTPQNAIRPTDTMAGGDVKPLGRLQTPAHRVIVFPNSHIHRLSSMCSSDGEDAVRRIVVFWLVNPDRPIISTKNVAPQQQLMPMRQALRNRLALMAERKLHKESFEQREVFLCEH